MHRFVDFTLNGITTGMIYAAVAIGLVLIWRGTRILNFAQGGLATFTTFVAVTILDRHTSYWLAFLAALATGALLGAVIERTLIRPVEGKPPLNAVIVTLGLLILLESVAAMIWGNTIRGFPAPFTIKGVTVGHTRIALSTFDIFTIAVVLAMMLALLVLFRFTNLGMRMRATAFAPEIARLLGVRVGRMLTLGWALAALAGALAGLLISPTVLLYPNNMDTIFLYGFTAAILGGLDSPVGAIVGSLVIGLSLSYITGYLGSELQSLGALVILVVVLMIRPQGIFTSTSARRV